MVVLTLPPVDGGIAPLLILTEGETKRERELSARVALALSLVVERVFQLESALDRLPPEVRATLPVGAALEFFGAGSTLAQDLAVEQTTDETYYPGRH